MLIFTIDRFGNAGHPTKRFDLVRKLLKRKQIKLIGGGASKKPVVIMFLDRTFDYEKTIDRKFTVTVDTGFKYIGYAVCEIKDNTLIVLMKGVLETRTSEIEKLMLERKGHRQFRRYCQRKNKKKLCKKQRRNVLKFKQARYNRGTRKRSATLQHSLQTHINVFNKALKLTPVPKHQVLFGHENARFDLRKLVYGKTNDYKTSPQGKLKNETMKDFVFRKSEHKCFVCGTTVGLHDHHVKPRHLSGTNRAKNRILLCSNCHDSVHKGFILVPIQGTTVDWKAASCCNQVCGLLRKEFIDSTPISVNSCLATRQRFNFTKSHSNDAVIVAATMTAVNAIVIDDCFECNTKQYRRHNRARTDSQRDRNYKFEGKVIAKNRHKRIEQSEDSLQELRVKNPSIIGKLKVYPGIKVSKPRRCDMFSFPGDIWIYKNQRFVAQGITSKKYIYSQELKNIVGKEYILPDKCTKLLHNEGIIVV